MSGKLNREVRFVAKLSLICNSPHLLFLQKQQTPQVIARKPEGVASFNRLKPREAWQVQRLAIKTRSTGK